MSLHAFLDESTRRHTYIICVATLLPGDLVVARQVLRSLRVRGQRRIHFSTESDQRRRGLLREMSRLAASAVIYVAKDRNEVAARTAILTACVVQLREAGVSRLVLEARDGQDHRDRVDIYRTLGPSASPPFSYMHQTASNEPLLWVPDAVAWAWGRGGVWRQRVEELGLVSFVEVVEVG